MLVVDGRIVLSPPGAMHYLGEQLGATLEIDHVPPGETVQIDWRWRTPAAATELYRFLVNGPASSEKSRTVVLENGQFLVTDDPKQVIGTVLGLITSSHNRPRTAERLAPEFYRTAAASGVIQPSMFPQKSVIATAPMPPATSLRM